MQETRPPEGPNLKEAFMGDSETVEALMDKRLKELEGHDLVQRKQVSMIEALEIEIKRVQLLRSGNRTNQAALRCGINDANDAVQKLARAYRKASLAFKQIKSIK